MYQELIKQIVCAISRSGQTRTLVSRPATRPTLTFDALEERNLLAATYTLDAGVLTINGDDTRDVVVLFQLENSTFNVEEHGVVVGNYSNDDVTEIVFRGRLGDDEFINNTFESSTFYGHGGNDVFYGGVGIDTAYGGGDDDELHGGVGADNLNGSDGNDTIYGDQGEDRIFGGLGDDLIFGGDDDDFLSAEEGNDVLYGGLGDDFLRGYEGNDTIHGEEGNDLVYGQAGDDVIYGNEGNDRLRGNNDNDTIYGQAGNDVLIGDVGDDIFWGGEGDDIHYGWTGDDIHYGEDGNDRMFDGEGNDQMYGGNGNDVLRSGSGNDFLKGEDGSDTLRGEDGRDRLYGGAGLDRLFAGWGDDSVHGGSGTHIDLIHGEQGSDRFHQDDDDDIIDRDAEDVTILYETTFVDWFDAEVEVLDNGFQQLFDLAGGSNVLLRETYNTSDVVTLYKYQELPGTTSRNIINEVTGKREIHIVDFDEETDLGRNFFRSEIVRQIANNWNSVEELSTAFQSVESEWQTFLDFSDWTQVDPQDSNYDLSGDGQWWHLDTAEFASFIAQENPYEDFVQTWVATVEGTHGNGLLPKVNWLTNLVRSQ